MSDWTCPACQAVNAETDVSCENCATAPKQSWKWAQPCPEPGCGLTVGEHRDQIKRHLATIAGRTGRL